jgi:hypothetical protein
VIRLDAAGKRGADGQAETGEEQDLSWIGFHERYLVDLWERG